MKKIFKMKKASVLFLSLILAASMLTACSGTKKDNTTEKTDANNTSNNSAEETKEPVEITMWGSWGGDQVAQLEAQIANFNNSQDEIIVKYAVQDSLEQKLLTAIASNEVPDIVLWDRFNTGVYAPKGALSPLDDLVKRDGIDLTKFYEPAVDELTSNGTLYGIPLTVDARVLFYNKDMFAEANIDPASIQTWDDLRDAAIKLTKRENGTLVQAGLSLRDVGLFNNWIVQAGGKMIDDSTNPPTVAFNTQAGLDVLTFWSKLQNEDKVYDLGFEDGYGGDGFKAGKVAITYNGPWTLESYKDAGLNFGVIQPVEGPTGIRSAMMGGFGLAIPNKAKHMEEAWTFIKWWTTQPENGVEFAKISGNLPANIDAAADPYFMEDEILSVFSEAMSYANIRSKVLGYSDVEGLALIPQLQLFMSGEITAEEALKVAEEQGNNILKEAAQ